MREGKGERKRESEDRADAGERREKLHSTVTTSLGIRENKQIKKHKRRSPQRNNQTYTDRHSFTYNQKIVW